MMTQMIKRHRYVHPSVTVIKLDPDEIMQMTGASITGSESGGEYNLSKKHIFEPVGNEAADWSTIGGSSVNLWED